MSAILLLSAVLIGWLGAAPAAAQCSGGMMGMCMGGENCHAPGEQCSSTNCPEGMMGSCMDSTECNSGMMGGCHEGGGGGMGCGMEECPMGEECMMGMMGECGSGMMSGCQEMMEDCCGNTSPTDRRAVRLHLNPNPFNPTTNLSFTLQEAANIDLRIFDSAARQVRVLAAGNFSAGEHIVGFSADNLPAGIYFARLQVAQETAIVKLVLLK